MEGTRLERLLGDECLADPQGRLLFADVVEGERLGERVFVPAGQLEHAEGIELGHKAQAVIPCRKVPWAMKPVRTARPVAGS